MNPLDSISEPSPDLLHPDSTSNLNTRSRSLLSDTIPKPAPPLPTWNPDNPFIPRRDEYLQLYEETERYHHRTDGRLDNFAELHAQIPPLPAPLEVFTDTVLVMTRASDLRAHLGELRYLYGQCQAADARRKSSARSVARAPTNLKTALPTVYDGTASKVKTFLAECHNFMALNVSDFSDDQFRVRWTLQLCSDRAATWKRTQLELLESGTDVPDHLVHWSMFQQNFLLTWADLNARNKAQARLLTGVKQTTSV